ncbi:glutamate--tRNA ligase [Desulfoscipio gibsoniae]|uniref:Glutamate--tRNA ligase n=1 Tax=Desulfoscipio gibsoniae DSM 7213 TaxID=767817 RepID=R4KBF6_9FIRM|nr:glutamate--tRNA ligase [Desulfoscipio gibsoniae]AGK99918.1 glutamyl-tRNA synthetase [Desulfoscipio gibsoniae DSM 7213]
MTQTKVRFAPSPTGPLHIGGARSALFNWLFARRYGGKFVVRIEDTDLDRSSRASEENILSSLRWLGLDWDEGIDVGGDNGPYRQTERLKIYSQYAAYLLEKGLAYRCYCSEEELAAQREAQLAAGEMVRYTGKCRDLGPEDCARLEAEGRKPVLRFRVPSEKIITVRDIVRGNVNFDCAGIGDFIIIKSDDIPTYNFAVVVDDHLMGINHVIRAEEHLSNTPLQVLLYEALGWDVPEFAHVSLILGKDRSKMSKRHGATSIEQYRELGYLPEALVNFLALLGWSPGTEEEVFTLDQLKEQFSLERVSKSPAVFDLEKLNWLNGSYIRHSPMDRLAELALPYLQKAGYLPGAVDEVVREKARLIVAAVKDRLEYMAQINDYADVFFNDPGYDDAEARKILAQEQVPAVIKALQGKMTAHVGDLDEAGAQALLKKLPKELGLGGKKVYQPLRVALTGKVSGPDLHHLLPVLGAQRVIARLEKALASSRPETDDK